MKTIVLLTLIASISFLSGCDDVIETKFYSEYDVDSPYYIPPGPDSLRINKLSTKHIELKWLDRSVNESGFSIKITIRRSITEENSNTFITPPNTTSFIDSLPIPQSSYIIYAVGAINKLGGVKYKEWELKVNFPGVFNITYENLGKNKMKFRWAQNDIYENSGYKIYLNNGAGWLLLDSLKSDAREYILDTSLANDFCTIRISNLYGTFEASSDVALQITHG